MWWVSLFNLPHSCDSLLHSASIVSRSMRMDLCSRVVRLVFCALKTVRFDAVNCCATRSARVSGSYDASVRLWDCRSHANEPIQVLKEPRDSVTSIVIRGHELLVG